MPKNIYWLNKESRNFLSKGYLKDGQTPEQRIRQIAEEAERILCEKGFADKFEDYMHKGYFSLSSPIWSNFGNGRGLSISCNGSVVYDSLDSIIYKTAETGMLTKHGAGTSAFLGKLRARGQPISTGGVASGPVHYLELFNTMTNVVSQSNVRRGSFAAYLNIDHPDILEFLNIREIGHPIQEISLGVTVPNYWMQEMVDGDKGKRKIWARVIKKRFESGYPYIFFSDNVNDAAPDVYKDKGIKIYASNLCVAPETNILTDVGNLPIGDLEGQAVRVWNGEDFSLTRIVKTGESKRLTRIEFTDGTEIYATPEHKWYITKDYKDSAKGVETEKRTFELQIGDNLVKFALPIIQDGEQMIESYTHGAYCADGFDYDGKKRIWLYGDKIKLLPHLSIEGNPGKYDESTDRLGAILNKNIKEKFYVPINGSLNTKLRWLEGFMDCEGHVATNQENQSLQASSIHKYFVLNIQSMLQGIGIFSKVADGPEEGFRMMPDGRGGSKEYFCQKAWRLLINSSDLTKLKNLGFSPKKLYMNNFLPQRDATRFVKVKSITVDARICDTYCCNEPEKHRIVLNGHLTGNCSEITLSSSESETFVCNLSSLNLLHFDEWKDTDAPETLTYFLDAVMSDYIEKTKDISFLTHAHNFAKSQRALGVGTLGWHSYLQSKMIAFESIEAKILNTKTHRLIKDKVLSASKEMSAKYGEPELLKGYGRRNVTLMAIAPTTSSSYILGQVSPSVEPLFANIFIKDLAKSKTTYKNPYLQAILKEKGRDNNETWDDILVRGGSVQHISFLSDHEKQVFKTFGEISQKEIVLQAIARGKFVDQAQSINLVIHPKTSPKDVNELLIFAWQNKLKTLYYQRGTSEAQELGRSIILECKSCEA